MLGGAIEPRMLWRSRFFEFDAPGREFTSIMGAAVRLILWNGSAAVQPAYSTAQKWPGPAPLFPQVSLWRQAFARLKCASGLPGASLPAPSSSPTNRVFSVSCYCAEYDATRASRTYQRTGFSSFSPAFFPEPNSSTRRIFSSFALLYRGSFAPSPVSL